MRALEGQCAIITGAAGSLGYATAECLAAAGAAVVLADLGGVEDAASRLSGDGHVAMGATLDVTDKAGIERVVDMVIARFGRVDILVNNAGIASSLKPQPFETISDEDWQRLHDVNVMGVVRMCAAVSPHMRKAKSGRIINLTSSVAFKGPPGLLHYVATKGAMISVTRSLASEFAGDNVLVNAVSPGFTPTDSMAASPELVERFSAAAMATRLIKREARPADIAKVIRFLASPDADFVTGQVVVADGGSVLH